MTPEPGPHPASVVLVGPPGAGKSTIGRKLARELGAELVDTDAVIEAETGRTIPEIFTTDGEPEFRRLEEDVVRRAVLAERGIVSLGGGAILSAATRELLRDRTVVYLEISVAEGLRRTGATTHRPLLAGADPAAKYRELMRTRRPLYREVASVRVRTEGRSPSRVVRNILDRLGLEPVEPKPVVTQARPDEGLGAANRRSRRRRRGGRPGANKTAATTAPATRGQDGGTPDEPRGKVTDTSADSSVAQQYSPAGESGAPSRSRRSRRGGRRRSKASNAAAPQHQNSPANDQGTEPSTAETQSGRSPAPGSGSGSARRDSASPSAPPSGTPASAAKTGESSTGTTQQRSARSRGHRAARRPAGPPPTSSDPEAAVSDTARRASEANSSAAHQNYGASARSGRSRQARTRRARTIRAQRESEQSA